MTVRLENGTELTFEGRAVVPGRRLVGAKSDVEGLMRVYKMYQKAANATGGEEKRTSFAGAGKACKEGEVRCGGECKRRADCLKWADEGSSAKLDTIPADRVLTQLDKGNIEFAREEARRILEDESSSKSDLRIASLVVGKQHAEDVNYASALKALDVAAAPIGPEERAGMKEWRAVALLERGKVLLNMGALDRAKSDLTEASVSGSNAVKGESRFLLGYIAIEVNDAAGAKTHFAAIPSAKECHEWISAANEAKKAAGIP